MLSLCGFLILIMIGFLFVRKENKSKVVNLIKENAPLVGMVLLLLFFFRGSVEGITNVNDTTNDSIIKDDYSMGPPIKGNSTKGKKGNPVMKGKKGMKGMTDKKKHTTGDTVMGFTQVDYASVDD